MTYLLEFYQDYNPVYRTTANTPRSSIYSVSFRLDWKSLLCVGTWLYLLVQYCSSTNGILIFDDMTPR